MKLRMQGNSVRLRLTRSEVERFRSTGNVEESVDFGGGELLAYRLSRSESGLVQAGFRQGSLAVTVPMDIAQAWANSDEVGVYAQSGALAISIEKDFRCLTRPREGDEIDAYPHPGDPADQTQG